MWARAVEAEALCFNMCLWIDRQLELIENDTSSSKKIPLGG